MFYIKKLLVSKRPHTKTNKTQINDIQDIVFYAKVLLLEYSNNNPRQ